MKRAILITTVIAPLCVCACVGGLAFASWCAVLDAVEGRRA